MRKATFFIAIMCLFSIPSLVKAQYILSYTDGNIVKGSGASYGTETHELSAAIYLDAAKLAPVKGRNIVKISVGLINMTKTPVTSYGDLTVWIKTDLESKTTLASAILPKSKVQLNDWNEITLETPLSIPEGALYVGYTIQANRLPIAYDGNTILETPNANHQGEDGSWAKNPKMGNLCIKAYVAGDNIPNGNVALTNLMTPSLVKSGGKFTIIANVENKAGTTINSLDIVCKSAGNTIATAAVDGLNIAFDEDAVVTIPGLICNTLGTDMDVEVSVSKINGSIENVGGADDVMDFKLSCLENCVPRKVFMEHFTTLSCGNCPAGLALIKKAIEGNEEDIVWVAHHVGFETDMYTYIRSMWFLNFYGVSESAPALMIDRTNWADYGATISSGGSNIASVGPVFNVASADMIRNIMNVRLSEYSPVEISEIKQNYVAAGELNVTIEGKCLQNLDGTPAISLFLIENGLFGGAHGVQDHVVRYIANKTEEHPIGDTLSINTDGSFSVSYVINLKNSGWDLANVKLAAAVTNLSEDINGNYVYNAKQVDLYDDGSGIDADVVDSPVRVYAQEGKIVVEGENTSFDVYTVDGKMITNNNLPNGIYIVKIMNGKQLITKKVQL